MNDATYTEIDREICVQQVPELNGCRVFTAIGDSLTEGYWGRMYDEPVLGPEDAPPDSISKDRRNFPTPGPTTTIHAEGQKFMKSWMPELNDLLAPRLGPVFIDNEGVGGICSAEYIELMISDKEWHIEDKLSPRAWRARQELLRPDSWLIHLGVNDACREEDITPDAYDSNLRRILDILGERYEAKPQRIWIALPSYGYYDDSVVATLTEFAERVRRIHAEGLAMPGPDFFDFFSRDKEKHYGDDPVHPNPLGVSEMARLWAEAILAGQGQISLPVDLLV